jgi:hypothetical protein
MKVQLSYAVRLVVLSGIFLCGCRTAHNVAVSSFRVIDAPANYVRRHIDDDEGTTTTSTTTTYQSDVVTPGQPIVGPPPTQRRMTTERHTDSETDRERSATIHDRQEPRSRPSSSSSPHSASSTSGSKIPYAKPVPGKPGYVYSPFDPDGGYVDVTGYASGSKAKDPYSGKIFIVP